MNDLQGQMLTVLQNDFTIFKREVMETLQLLANVNKQAVLALDARLTVLEEHLSKATVIPAEEGKEL